MRLCVLDFETYWSSTHSLTKMSPIVYVQHPDTEIISVAYKFDGEPTQVVFGESAIQAWADATDWSDVMVVAHNMSGFDAMICAWRLGMRPKMWGCTMAMARPFFQSTVGVSLKAVSEALGLGAKGDLLSTNTKGKRLEDFTKAELDAMRTYNALDTDLCHGVFQKLAPLTSRTEAQLIDLTIRMLVEPALVLDVPLLEATRFEEQERRRASVLDLAARLQNVGLLPAEVDPDNLFDDVKAVLASSAKFARLLRMLGVPVPMKPSPSTPGKEIPALAKSDEGMQALVECDDPLVSAAASVRLDVKSTILESRIERFLEAAAATNGFMPVPLAYHAAISSRWGGTMNLNMQNMPRIPRDSTGAIIPQPSNALRLSLRAPKGHKVVVADLSGVELRVNMFLWDVPYAVKLFREDPKDADLYKALAADVFNVLYNEVQKPQRQAAKAMALGCGFGLRSADKFCAVAKALAGLTITTDEAARYIEQYRRKHPEVVAGWARSHAALAHIVNREYGVAIDPAGLCVTAEGGIKTPVGFVRYPMLRQEDREWVYGDGRNKTRIYAGKVTENIVQHLARCIMAEQMLAISKRYKVAHSVHDEVICVVPESEAEECLQFMLETMSTAPTWWPGISLSAEGDIADSYGDAK